MRRSLVLLVTIALAFLCPQGSFAQDIPAAPPRAVGPVADSLRAIALRMIEHLRNRDTPSLIALYGDTMRFVHVEEGTIIPWSELSPMMRSYLASVSSNPVIVIGEPGVTLIDDRNAVLYVTHRFEGGSGRDSHEGVWSGVMHRFADGWKVVHSHSSDKATQR